MTGVIAVPFFEKCVLEEYKKCASGVTAILLVDHWYTVRDFKVESGTFTCVQLGREDAALVGQASAIKAVRFA